LVSNPINPRMVVTVNGTEIISANSIGLETEGELHITDSSEEVCRIIPKLTSVSAASHTVITDNPASPGLYFLSTDNGGSPMVCLLYWDSVSSPIIIHGHANYILNSGDPYDRQIYIWYATGYLTARMGNDWGTTNMKVVELGIDKEF